MKEKLKIMGYLSGSSPHIKSGAVLALSVLVHNDVNICFLIPDLVPSVLELLQSYSHPGDHDAEVWCCSSQVTCPREIQFMFYAICLTVGTVLFLACCCYLSNDSSCFCNM